VVQAQDQQPARTVPPQVPEMQRSLLCGDSYE
jgi:hypothetical protein